MAKLLSRPPINEDPRASGGVEKHQPGDPLPPKTTMHKDLDEEGPVHRIKRLRNIHLEQNGGHLSSMQNTDRLVHHHEIIHNTSAAQKRPLIGFHQLLDKGRSLISQELRNNLAHTVNKTNRAEI